MSVSVRTEVVVEAPPERAFRVFTEKAENWWPATHHIGKAPMQSAMMERRDAIGAACWSGIRRDVSCSRGN